MQKFIHVTALLFQLHGVKVGNAAFLKLNQEIPVPAINMRFA